MRADILDFVKINKRKSHFWSREASRGSSYILPLVVNCRPKGREGLSMWRLLNYPRRRKRGFPPLLAAVQPMRDCHNSTNERPLYSECPVCSSGLLFIRAHHPSSLLFSRKSPQGTCPWFCHSLLVQDGNSLLFLNKSIFCW